MKSLSFISPLSVQMGGHNLCNLQLALPRCAPQVLSIFAGRGSPFSAGRGGVGRGAHPWLRSISFKSFQPKRLNLNHRKSFPFAFKQLYNHSHSCDRGQFKHHLSFKTLKLREMSSKFSAKRSSVNHRKSSRNVLRLLLNLLNNYIRKCLTAHSVYINSLDRTQVQ